MRRDVVADAAGGVAAQPRRRCRQLELFGFAPQIVMRPSGADAKTEIGREICGKRNVAGFAFAGFETYRRVAAVIGRFGRMHGDVREDTQRHQILPRGVEFADPVGIAGPQIDYPAGKILVQPLEAGEGDGADGGLVAAIDGKFDVQRRCRIVGISHWRGDRGKGIAIFAQACEQLVLPR